MPIESRWIADWLFTHPTHPFHHHTSIPADAFDNSLAIRGLHLMHQEEGSSSGGIKDGSRGVSTGNDILLVGIAHSGGNLIGYSFGGLVHKDAKGEGGGGGEEEGGGGGGSSREGCGFDAREPPMFPHFVGRFAFDVERNDLLIVVNQLNDYATGIVSVKRGDGRVRERTLYAVANGNYGYKKLPIKMAKISIFSERRLAAIPKYQFATGGESSKSDERRGSVRTDMKTITADLAKIERLVKGKFFSPKMIMDHMEMDSGELTKRVTAQVEARFDVMDAVGMQVFRDTAMRSYYSYMSSVSGSGSGKASASRS